MTQDEAWKKEYDEALSFITENGRNLSKYNLEDRRLYTWLKHQRKVMNAGEIMGDWQLWRLKYKYMRYNRKQDSFCLIDCALYK